MFIRKESDAKCRNTIKKYQFRRSRFGALVYFSNEHIINVYKDECYQESLGLYRNKKIQLNKSQLEWKKYLENLNYNYSFLITFRLPHTNQNGFKRTRNRTQALTLYRKLVKEFECIYKCTSHWERNPLPFIGVIEHGKRGFWHVHLAITTLSVSYIYLEAAAPELIKRHHFYRTVVDIEPIYDTEGLFIYFCKELGYLGKNEGEGSGLFDLQQWYHIKPKKGFNNNIPKIAPTDIDPSDSHDSNYWLAVAGKRHEGIMDLHMIVKLLYTGLKSKLRGALYIPNPINKLRRHSKHLKGKQQNM